jgi:tetratricopeptide (TPR) repeat protein
MKKTIVSILLLITTFKAFCGVVDHDIMYQTYLNNDMKRWGTEIQKYINQPDLTIDDKIDISNYFYGYIAAILETEKKNVIESLLKIWNSYLDEIEATKGNRADIHVYRAAISAYKFKLNPMLLAQATRSLNELDKALNIDPNNFLAIGLKGNVKFYMPGNKKDAIIWFERALENLDTANVYRWNRCAITLCLAQAYEKTGNKEKAIKICQTILTEEPNFKYMRDIYYPSIK